MRTGKHGKDFKIGCVQMEAVSFRDLSVVSSVKYKFYFKKCDEFLLL